MKWPCPLALALSLAACGQLSENTPPAASSAPAAPAKHAPTAPRPVAKPSATPEDPVVKPSATPEELIGLDEPAVQKLLGAPIEAHDDGPARVLSYRARGCSLDVIFFLDLKAGALRVASYQLEPPVRPKSCYNELRTLP